MGKAMPDFTSMILRFRDLSTPAGTTTIDEHVRIIREHEHVWWGWWRKQGETVPEVAFREIFEAIRATGPFRIFLFDTGKYRLYRAQLTDIQWHNRLQSIPTPDREITPNYYGDSHYLAWFKMDFIGEERVDENELSAWSYVRVDDFTIQKSRFLTPFTTSRFRHSKS